MPKKVTIFHKETGAAELYSIDARDALNNHPGEWSAKPWPEDKVKAKKGKETGAAELVAKDDGSGVWFAFDGDAKVGEAMSKEDAEAFNALSADERAKLVKKA